ncbi:MAG TPA: VCBS repeat-containing protein [Polyangia bacterium]|nr:VCBS repeat-containing protein [Polyangia bacterium]
MTGGVSGGGGSQGAGTGGATTPAGGSGGATAAPDAGMTPAAGDGGTISAPDAGMPVTTQKRGSLKFTRKDLNRLNLAEASTFGDYNKDGHVDVLSGPYWFEGPDFTKYHELDQPSCTPANPKACNCYACMSLGDWANFTWDVDGDGWPDAVRVYRPGTASYWFKNPGMTAVTTDMHWTKGLIGTLSWEQVAFVDMAGKGVPGLVGVANGSFGWFDPGTNAPWTWHTVAGGAGGLWVHGIGAGMVDGKNMDYIAHNGWWSPPAGGPESGPWMAHPYNFGDGSQMFAYDVNGDGTPDIVASLAAHGYGVAWFEQKAGTFTQHVIVGGPGDTMNAGGITSFSQPHDLLLIDVDGDGLKDIITGKSFYAHPPGTDPGAADTPVTYIFKLIRGEGGAVTWEPHLIDSEVGLGKGGLSATDFNEDGVMDFAVGGKHGVFVYLQDPM